MKLQKNNRNTTLYLNRLHGATLVGIYGMPQLEPCNATNVCNPIAFHIANATTQTQGHWYHFFEYDYQIERMWNRPTDYLEKLRRFDGGISPDYSMYVDMPGALQVWNCWRNRTMAYWMQKQGLNVIPNACWGDEQSLTWAFDGLPQYSALAFTTQGCMQRTNRCKQVLVNGIHELIRQKHPTQLFVYGKFPEEWLNRFSVPIIVLPTFSDERFGGK